MGAAHVPIVALLAAMMSIQGGASLAKSLFPELGAVGAVTLRLVFGAAILAALHRPWRRSAGGAAAPRRPWRALAVYGVSLGLMNLTFYLALARIPLGVAVALEFVGPLMVAVASSRRLRDMVWVTFAAGGVVLLSPLAGGVDAIDPAGAALALTAGGFWGLYIIFGQKAGADHGPRAVALGAVIAAAVAAPVGVAHTGAGLWAPELFPVAAAVAILSTVIPYSLEMFSLTRLPRRVFGVMMSVEPAMGALFGLLVLSEALTASQWGAIGLVMVASVGVTASGAAATEAAPTARDAV